MLIRVAKVSNKNIAVAANKRTTFPIFTIIKRSMHTLALIYWIFFIGYSNACLLFMFVEHRALHFVMMAMDLIEFDPDLLLEASN